MRIALRALLIVGWLVVTSRVGAQSALPPRWHDLPKLAASWPPAWAALVGELAPPRDDFEKDVLHRVGVLLRAEEPSKETYRLAEIVLAATLRHHHSVRRTAPLADNPSQQLHAELEERLANVRKDWLNHLQKTGHGAEALRLAEQWLPATANDIPLRASLISLWANQAKTALEKADYAAARTWLNRLETQFGDVAPIAPIGNVLQDRAQSLLKESHDLPDAQAIRVLEEALSLWPRLPDARDALERRKGSYRTLLVAVRSLPEQLSPATAWIEVEKQSLELLFDRLYHVEQQPKLGKRYRPQLATLLPSGALRVSIKLRGDVYWSSGERLTAADLRHTALLMNQPDALGRSALWRDFLEIPRLEENLFQLNVGFRQGLFDPLAPLTFWVLPQNYHGKQLQRADDAEFAKAPLASGPFQYAGRKNEADNVFALFQANPHDLRHGPASLREIRMMRWADPRKGLPKPLPHLILDPPTDQLSAYKELGYAEFEGKTSPCVHFLAVNHRKPSLATVSVRRAIAHKLDRQDLLNRHFRSEALKGKYHAPANGLFPRESWANAPSPRVPADFFQAEQARSFARQVKKESVTPEWTLKYPADDARVKSACEDIARAIGALFQEAQIKIDVQPQGLPPHALRKAIHERDYDLLYTSAERLDDPVRLALLFDRHEEATRAGGNNYLGYDNDDKLHELLRAVKQHRQFTAIEESMQAIHVHLFETMPVIPLWHLDTHVLIHPTLRTPTLDPRAVFANVRQWKVVP
jgi:ABC-type transport system substrate-binding protein